jgi:four helix bundle protein
MPCQGLHEGSSGLIRRQTSRISYVARPGVAVRIVEDRRILDAGFDDLRHLLPPRPARGATKRVRSRKGGTVATAESNQPSAFSSVPQEGRHEGLPQAEGLARGPRVGALGVSSYGRVPLGRTIWADRQLRRASVSVPANLAEGCGRYTDQDFARFVDYAMGSASEAEYHLLLARDLGLLDVTTHAALHGRTTEVKRMLASFLASLRADR